MFDLRLGPIARAFCGVSSPEAQRRIDAILAEHPASEFARRHLEASGLSWAAALTDPCPATETAR